MKFLFAALIAVALAMLAAVAVLTHHRGSQGGDVVVQERPVAGFSRVVVYGMADVKLVQGPAESLTIEAAEAALTDVVSKVSGRTLTIRTTQERRWWESLAKGRAVRSPRITIGVRELERFEGAGAVKVVADNLRAEELAFDLSGACSVKIGDLQVARLRFDGSGATKAELGGKATRQEVDLSGAGVYQAGEARQARYGDA